MKAIREDPLLCLLQVRRKIRIKRRSSKRIMKLCNCLVFHLREKKERKSKNSRYPKCLCLE